MTHSITINPGQPDEQTFYFYEVDCTLVYQEGGDGGGFGGGGDTGGGDEPGSGCVNPWDVCTDDGSGGAQGHYDVEAFMGDIIIDASILNNDKARCVLENLFDGKVLAETIVNFASETVDINLILELSDLGPATGEVNGNLESSNLSDTYMLQLNENRISNRTPVEIATTYLHESIHAEKRRYLYGATNTSTLPGFPGDFASDWPKYVQSKFGNVENAVGSAEHNAMAEKYVNIIADGLQDYDNNQLSRGHYEALAWNGLVDLEPWDNLTQSKKTEYGTKYSEALEGRSLNCN